MTPREQLRKMTALGEPGPLEEKHWYRLVNGMSTGELRQRQELMMRNQMVMAPQIMAQGQQRLQGVPAQFEARFMERELVPPSDMVSAEARHMHLGPHLGGPLPPHTNVLPGRSFPGPGYTFLPSEPMETVARRQELLHKQNIARMEMNAILHQKELESQQKGLLMDGAVAYPANPLLFRGRQRLPDGHDVFVHRPSLDELHSGSILMSAAPYPPVTALHRERGRRAAGRRPTAHKNAEGHGTSLKVHAEDKGAEQSPGAVSGEEKEEPKGEADEDCGKTHHHARMDTDLTAGSRKSYKEGESGLRKTSGNVQDGCSDGTSSAACDKDTAAQCSAFQEKFLFPSAGGTLPGTPYMFPTPGNGFLPPGAPSLFLNGDEVPEDIRKWTVSDVYSFVSSIPSCSEYAQTFKDHLIDGETLPLLSEEHLLDTLGMKLGPALKIRSQVSRRLGSVLYMMNLPLSAAALQGPGSEKPGDRLSELGSPTHCASEEMVSSPRDPDALKTSELLQEAEGATPPSVVGETA